jgi:hypothetical protein
MLGLVASVVVYETRAAVPTMALTDAGYYLAVEPVAGSDLSAGGLTSALREIAANGNPPTQALTRDEFKQRVDPVLETLIVRSWLALAKKGASYGICWTDEYTRVAVSCLDKRGRFVDDPEHEKRLAADAPIEAVVEVIVDDLKRRGVTTL